MKKILKYLGIQNSKSFVIFAWTIVIGLLWLIPIYYMVFGIQMSESEMFDMAVSAETIPNTINTRTENNIGLLILTRYSDVIRIALVTTNDTDIAWCDIEEDILWKKQLKKIEENKFFGEFKTTHKHIRVCCYIDNETIETYSIYSDGTETYEKNLSQFVFTVPINDLSRSWRRSGCIGCGAFPVVPY